MQEYVQKSTNTTLPRNSAGVSGAEFSQAVAPLKDGISPSIGSAASCAPGPCMAMVILALRGVPPGGVPPLILSMSDDSSRLVPPMDQRVSTLLSQPEAMARTASNTATPNPRLTHSPAPS